MSLASLLLALLAALLVVLILVAAGLLSPAAAPDVQPQDGTVPDLKAAIFCGGPAVSPRYHRQDGYGDCRVAAAVQGGDRACMSGCLGYGSCVEACPQGAISLDENALPHVSDACTACGRCMAVCPRNVIRLIPREADFIVACSSKDAPSKRTLVCRHPCTGCGICASVNSSGGYRINKQTSLAHIDYSKQGDRHAGQYACPKTCIRPATKAV